MKKLIFGFCAVASLGLMGCEDEEMNAIAKAQGCLDQATTPAAGTACKAMVAGYSSPEAYGIACASGFIEGGITGTRISTAVGNMLDGVGTADPAMILMGSLSFPSSTLANATFTDCERSLSKGYIFFASAARLGTLIAEAAETGAPGSGANLLNGTATPAEIQTAITQAIATPPPPATVGAIATTVYTTQCATINSSNESLCTEVTAAINAHPGDLAAIGTDLLGRLQN